MLLVLSASCPRAPACGRHLRVPKPAARCRVVRGPAAGRVQASAAGSDGGSEGEAATAHNTGQDTKAAATAKSIDRLLGLDQMESQTPAAAQEPPTVVKPAQPLAARRVRRRCQAPLLPPPPHCSPANEQPVITSAILFLGCVEGA